MCKFANDLTGRASLMRHKVAAGCLKLKTSKVSRFFYYEEFVSKFSLPLMVKGCDNKGVQDSSKESLWACWRCYYRWFFCCLHGLDKYIVFWINLMQ